MLPPMRLPFLWCFCILLHIYIYMCVCVCVCRYIKKEPIMRKLCT